MQVRNVIESAQSGEAMASLAARLGASEEEVRAAADVVLPELALALERNTLSRGGLASFVHALGDGHHEAVLDDPRAWSDPRVAADGNAILTHILGSEGRTRALAAKTERATGLSGSIAEALLPILAQMLMGAIARYMKGGLGDVLSKLPLPQGGGSAGRERAGGELPRARGGFELPRADLPTGGYPLPPVSTGREDRSEPPAEDAGGGFRWPGSGNRTEEDRGPRGGTGFELPKAELPRDGGYPMPPMPSGEASGSSGDNPYGDLSDILRRKRSELPAGTGNDLWSVVRGALGGALGFGNSGFLGWLIRLVAVRWGWTILRRLLLGR